MIYWLDPDTWMSIVEKLGLSADDWFPAEFGGGFIHWTGAQLDDYCILTSNHIEFLAAIDRYVARLSGGNIAHRKHLFTGYKEARQFCLDIFDWLKEHIGEPADDASIAIYIKDYHPCCLFLDMQLTESVPKALRDRLQQAKKDHEEWEASRIPYGSLVQHTNHGVVGEGKKIKITYDFVLPEEDKR